MKFKEEFIKSFNIFKKNIKNVLAFELIFNAISIGIIFILSKFIFNFTLSITGIKYLSNTTFLTWLKSPLTIIALFLSFFIWLFLSIIEISAIIRNYNSKTNLNCFEMIYLGIKDALTIFKAKSWRLIWYITIIVLLTCSIGAFNLFKSVYIPEYIETFITTRFILLILLIISLIVLFIYSNKWMYILYYFLLKKETINEAIADYKKKMKKSLSHNIIGRLLFSFVIILIFIMITFILCFIPIVLSRLLFNNDMGYEFSINVCYWIPNIIFLLFQILIVPLELAYMTVIFNDNNFLLNNKFLHKKTKILIYKTKIWQTIAIIMAIVLNLTITYISNMEKYTMMRKTTYIPQITAHRGSSIYAPENTMAAFKKAIEDNTDWIELDVHETKDGVLVVSHDANIKRITGKKAYIYDLTYDELQKYTIGSWINLNFQEEKIPTLEEVLIYCKGKVKLNIELKPTGHETNFVPKVIELIKKYNYQDDSYLASGKEYVLKEIKMIDENIKTIYDMMVAEGDITKFDFADVYSVEQSYINESLIKKVHNAGKTIYAWTVNDADSMHKFADMGIDNIVTDNPDLAKKILVNDRLKQKYTYLKYFFKFEVQ